MKHHIMSFHGHAQDAQFQISALYRIKQVAL